MEPTASCPTAGTLPLCITISGPKLPFKLTASAMVTSPNGKGVIVIGGYNDSEYKYSNILLELCGNCLKNMKWVQLEQTLQVPRSGHVAFQIPNYLTTVGEI